jgi:hypothetical protein
MARELCTEQQELTGDGVLAVLKNSGNGSPPLRSAFLPALPGAVLFPGGLLVLLGYASTGELPFLSCPYIYSFGACDEFRFGQSNSFACG